MIESTSIHVKYSAPVPLIGTYELPRGCQHSECSRGLEPCLTEREPSKKSPQLKLTFGWLLKFQVKKKKVTQIVHKGVKKKKNQS